MDCDSDNSPPSILHLAKLKFILCLPEHQFDNVLQAQLLEGIINGNMAPYYKTVCTDLSWNMDVDLLNKMHATNEEELSKFDTQSEMAEEDDYLSVWQDKLNYLCNIGDKGNAEELARSKLKDKSLSMQSRSHAVFALFRISYIHGCELVGMRKAIEEAESLILGGSVSDGAGDWSSRNKLKAYLGLYNLAMREYNKAACLFLDCVPTFESYELASFEDIVWYTLLACMVALPRNELQSNFGQSGEMAHALRRKCPEFCEYFMSLYECRYGDFFVNLAQMETKMRLDPLLHPHYRHYVREMKLRAYDQLLQAYSSFGLKKMSETFGVSEDFMEKEVAQFVADGRLQCKIDRVAKTVVTLFCGAQSKFGCSETELLSGAVHDREVFYQKIIKHGDNVLNRTKKLARVIDF
ncbi:hypothetical protein PR048_033120 [Dryococelus australis]|uniref:26S proteasome non-ATPase regulatory subunit 6 n=1 Tax=Dryococelus australis TaxID=614101 RepID=A0ABQ9FZB8_9NEOP|nr:hypothetical protein PR048_033120 [Dryococelus australis]